MAPRAAVEAVVAVTRWSLFLFGSMVTSCSVLAAVLPDDRADVLYHRYSGGGVTVDGPSVLVRKSIGQSVSLNANYYVDSVSSASVDVVSQASPYTEERTQTSISMDYLYNKSLMNLSYTKSDENDYKAETSSFSVSHDMFGDLTTVTLGYGVGNDEVGNNLDPTFSQSTKRQNYRLGLSQILTKNSLLSVNWETVTEEGYLNNPYRSFRIKDSSALGYSYQLENQKYPRTRTSNALAFRLKYFLPYRAALSGEYRYFHDTWGISASNVEIGYTHPLKENWIFDVRYRYYTQNAALFYSDLFTEEETYMARDKELSSYHDQTVGLGVSYEFKPEQWQFIDRGSLNLSLDYIRFDYDDFRDVTAGGPAGEEPLFSFSANVIKAYLSIWY